MEASRGDGRCRRAIGAALDDTGTEAAVFVAEDEERRPLGFVHVQTSTDFFTGEAHGHVSDLVVLPEAEGKGIGRALMEASEEWSRSRGHRLLSLNVFGKNTRARQLYERLGFAADTTKLVKVLRR